MVRRTDKGRGIWEEVGVRGEGQVQRAGARREADEDGEVETEGGQKEARQSGRRSGDQRKQGKKRGRCKIKRSEEARGAARGIKQANLTRSKPVQAKRTSHHQSHHQSHVHRGRPSPFGDSA